MSDPFEQFGDDLPKRRVRRRYVVSSEKEAPMVKRGAERAMEEDAQQLARYRRFWKQEMKALMEGANGPRLQDLMRVLKTLDMMSAEKLFLALESIDWLQGPHIDDKTRFLVLGMIDETIIRMRIRAGLAPIEDSLPGIDGPTVFEICREKLKPLER